VNRVGSLLGLSAILLSTGCSSGPFTEADEGTSREVDQGATFSISLAASPSSPARAPRIQGAYLRYGGRRLDEATGREIFQFVAEGVGESEIRIGPPGAPDGVPSDFVLRVTVIPSHAPRYGGPPMTNPVNSPY
jgi:hypothetical protein